MKFFYYLLFTKIFLFTKINCAEPSETKNIYDTDKHHYVKVQIRIHRRNINEATCTCQIHTLNRFFEINEETTFDDLIGKVFDECIEFETYTFLKKNDGYYERKLFKNCSPTYYSNFSEKYYYLVDQNLTGFQFKLPYQDNPINNNDKICNIDFKSAITNNIYDNARQINYDLFKNNYIVCNITVNFKYTIKKTNEKMIHYSPE